MNHHIAPRSNSATGVFARKRSFNWQHGQPPLKNTRGRQCLPLGPAGRPVLKRAVGYCRPKCEHFSETEKASVNYQS